MCERYLKLAEEKNDMKAIRNIMQTKRSLQRQQQRLKYNMAVEFNEKVFDKALGTPNLYCRYDIVWSMLYCSYLY